MNRWISNTTLRLLPLLVCLILLISCKSEKGCMAVRNNGKPHNYNHNMTRWAKYNARRCSGYVSLGITPTKIIDTDYQRTKRRLDKQAQKNHKRRLRSNLPII